MAKDSARFSNAREAVASQGHFMPNTMFKTSTSLFTFIFAIFLASTSHAATTQPDDVIEQAAAKVQKLFCDNPGGYETIFDPTFLKAVPSAKLTPIFTDEYKRLGKCVSFQITDRTSPIAAKGNFIFEKYAVPATISVNPAENNLIDSLWLAPAVPRTKSLDELVEKMKSLPGKCTFRVVRLGKDKLEVLASLEPDTPLAIGSAFKLYILAELVHEIEAGQRRWEDVVKLEAAAMSLPSGQLQKWPVGSPITLHTLAALMISNSDNTAADHLLHVLGREKVESILSDAGNEHAAMNRPFLSTREMFILHGDNKLADAFNAANADGRRKLLETSVASAPLDESKFSESPTHIDSIEWFASTNDLCRVMDYFRKHTESGPAADARKILSINPGLDIDTDRFPIVAFKGGSEPGVLNLTYLVQSRSGAWYALAATWNNPKAALTNEDLALVVTQAFQYLQ
jgi:beta-lactamase class A